MLPAPATAAPLVATAASAAPPAAPLVPEVNAILSGQYYFIISVASNSIKPVAFVFSYCLCIITILFLFVKIVLCKTVIVLCNTLFTSWYKVVITLVLQSRISVVPY